MDRVHNLIVHMLHTYCICTCTCTFIYTCTFMHTCTCVYQWSSANHLGGSERCSESESDNSYSY